jgi:hypothetical protein
MQEPQTPPTPERLTRLAFAFAPPLLLQTAVELQIFDSLDQDVGAFQRWRHVLV